MDLTEQRIEEALAGLQAGLQADGYALRCSGIDDRRVRIEIDALVEACPDCLVPKPIMASMIAQTLKLTPDQIELRYPHDAFEA